MAIIIHTLKLGSMDNFIHFVADTDSKNIMVVDPAWEAETILAFIDKNGYHLTGILLTHSHADHISALKPILAQRQVPVYISRTEFRLGRTRVKNPHYIEDGERIPLGKASIEVIFTPGHTSGGVCFLADKHLIAGDTLFIDGCGRCNFRESDVEQMWHSLQRLKQLPDDTVIHCGHDYGQQPTATIGQQKLTNPYFLIDDKAFFIEFRMHLQSQYRSIPFKPSSAAEMQAIRAAHQNTAAGQVKN